VQVLDHQQEPAVGQGFQGRGRLPQHALAGAGQGEGLEGLGLLLVQYPRHLREEGRRVAAQDGEDVRVGAGCDKLLHGLQQRHVGLATPVLLDALATQDPPGGRQRIRERIDERGLADPHLAGDEEHLAQAFVGCQTSRGQPGQFVVAAADGVARRTGGRGAFRLDGSDEAETPTMDRLDVAGGARIVAKRGAQPLQGRCQRCLTDDRIRPRFGQKIVLGHDLSCPGHEDLEDPPALGVEPDFDACTQQLLLGGQEDQISNA
jgi:hypothetical protein